MAFLTNQAVSSHCPACSWVTQGLYICCFYFVEFPFLESCISGTLTLYRPLFKCPFYQKSFLITPNQRSTLYSQNFPSLFCYFVFHSIYWHLPGYIIIWLLMFVNCPYLSLQLELRLACSPVLLYLLGLQVHVCLMNGFGSKGIYLLSTHYI